MSNDRGFLFTYLSCNSITILLFSRVSDMLETAAHLVCETLTGKWGGGEFLCPSNNGVNCPEVSNSQGSYLLWVLGNATLAY